MSDLSAQTHFALDAELVAANAIGEAIDWARQERRITPPDPDIAMAEMRLESKHKSGLRMLQLLRQEGLPIELLYWLNLDTWSVAEAMPILCNFCKTRFCHGSASECGDQYMRLDGLRPFSAFAREVLPAEALQVICRDFENRLDDMNHLWGSGRHNGDRHSIEYYLDWAARKRIDVPWLDWARENGHISVLSSKSNLVEVYPWGTHNTKLLSKLSEAAKKFWQLYDPSDKTTAPTNERVEEWLIGEGISKRIAETMATILRQDGLPTGKRE